MVYRKTKRMRIIHDCSVLAAETVEQHVGGEVEDDAEGGKDVP